MIKYFLIFKKNEKPFIYCLYIMKNDNIKKNFMTRYRAVKFKNTTHIN